uniref:hypothetical protein n=1 Tax=uncultured Tenacibaculum sp. TaxID=174713 RepID=UPI002615D451|nr:hypothetical protein [uncultured Tenacibaculum sp.]
MRNLTYIELIEINGGNTVPVVSDDSAVQAGYEVGYRIGRAVGNTLRQMGDMLDAVNPFDWFK